jgi:hypothetical protein
MPSTIDTSGRTKGIRPRHPAGRARGDLEHGIAVPRPDAQDAEREPPVVVRVDGNARGPMPRGEAGGDALLRRGLPQAARDRHERRAVQKPPPHEGEGAHQRPAVEEHPIEHLPAQPETDPPSADPIDVRRHAATALVPGGRGAA